MDPSLGGADCHEPICIKTDPFSTYKKYASKGRNTGFFDDVDSGSTSDSSNQEQSNTKSGRDFSSLRKDTGSQEPPKEGSGKAKEAEIDDYHACPNSRESLGFFTWNFLHTMAIYYPQKPSDDQKEKMRNFVTGLAEFYPCKVCAHHFRKDIQQSPPRVENNETLSVWFCEQHNIVNKFLGKKEFDCSFSNLQKRWKDGYPHCGDDSALH